MKAYGALSAEVNGKNKGQVLYSVLISVIGVLLHGLHWRQDVETIFVKYFYACLVIIYADMKPDNYSIRMKLAKMANQCAERITSYCEKPGW